LFDERLGQRLAKRLDVGGDHNGFQKFQRKPVFAPSAKLSHVSGVGVAGIFLRMLAVKNSMKQRLASVPASAMSFGKGWPQKVIAVSFGKASGVVKAVSPQTLFETLAKLLES
jgi:hypothetical protein